MDSSLSAVREIPVTVLKEAKKASNNIILSIVIPTYRRGNLLEESLYSVIKQVKDEPLAEVIVVSNDPDDNLSELCEKYQNYDFTVLKNTVNLGMCGNINKCLCVGRGKYVAYLHDDDLVTKDYIKEILSVIKNNPDIDCVIPARYILNGQSEWGKSNQKKMALKRFISTCMFPKYLHKSNFFYFNIKDIYKSGRNCFNAPTCGTVFKLKSIIDQGGFDASWKWSFDLAFYAEYCKFYKVALYKKPLGVYRMTDSASNESVVQLEFFDTHKKVMDDNKELKLVNKYYYEYLHLFYMGLAKGTRKLIDEKYGELMHKWNPIKYFLVRIMTQCYYYCSGIEAERYGMGDWYRE